ncbi:MAG: ATP synthase F1 subunit epsilon [Bacteroidota bacterium]|nr:ATP synthase F1 subunit epsilon [Chitinophagaceae bacterium]QLH46549.1 MAG: ATP synthase F1 subunit epsilon [Bacteroidota bacterium]
MHLDILTPERKIFNGDVYGVLLPGVAGYFELLDNHAPIVAALGKGQMKILKDKSNNQEVYNIEGGFVEMSRNKTIVLIEGAETVI